MILLTQGINPSLDIGNGEDTHNSVVLALEQFIHLCSKLALANDGDFQSVPCWLEIYINSCTLHGEACKLQLLGFYTEPTDHSFYTNIRMIRYILDSSHER